MKTKTCSFLIAALALLAFVTQTIGQGNAFTYQGRLNDGTAAANGTYDLQFTIYDSSGGPTIVTGPLTNPAVAVSNGFFVVVLDFGAGTFNGGDRWLAIGVRTNGSVAPYTALSPRQPLTASPYAIYSGGAGSVSNGLIQNPVFIGTTGNSPLSFYVDGQPALRLELNAVPDYTNAPNVIGGSLSNSAAAGVAGATIAGGGAGSYFGFPLPNRVNASFATVGGGGGNSSSGDFATIAGGLQNRASGQSSVVGGGGYNAARGASSTIGGGSLNTVGTNADRSVISGGEQNTVAMDAIYSVIAGGSQNTNGGRYATIGGGSQNTASDFYSTVPGGRFNDATGAASFAAGYRAKALHGGTFVWADSQDSDFRSTGFNQFLVRASGGVGIGITNPATALHVAGTVTANSFTGSGAGITNVNATMLGGVSSSNFWRLGGNAGANPATGNFLGTTDNLPLEFEVNGGRALRFEPNTNGAPNIIGGSQNNFVSNGVVGATIAGGGAAIYGFLKYTNSVSGDFGTISGGAQNTAGDNYATVGGGYLNIAGGLYATVSGGDGNTATGFHSTVGGGVGNIASADSATVSGGYVNTASSLYTTVGGGRFNAASNTYATVSGGNVNIASGDSATVSGGHANLAKGNNATVSGGAFNLAIGGYATVGGGYFNEASGLFATVPGGSANSASGDYSFAVGQGNTAGGDYSFAAGRRANANNHNTFVWADSQITDFTSTASNQFLIRAQGGVGINNNNPQAPLHVNGGGDASLSAGGNFISGVANGQNIVIDNNEIISRNNGAASDLILNFGSGNVGIRRVPSANALEVGGEASKSTAGNWLANSDARIKTGVQTISNALERLSRVRLVQFHYTDDYRAAHPGIEDREYLNVVAQEFQRVFPEEVKRSGEKLANGDDILQVDTYPLTIYSAAAVQELKQKLEEKAARISVLEEELSELKHMVKKLSERKN